MRDIDTAVADSLKVLDPNRPIREADITGHSLEDVEAILDGHYLGGRIELAVSAIEKLDAAYGASPCPLNLKGCGSACLDHQKKIKRGQCQDQDITDCCQYSDTCPH